MVAAAMYICLRGNFYFYLFHPTFSGPTTQELFATNLTGGKTVTVHRYYKKSELPPEIEDDADDDEA